jgi:hypothetical protein
VNLCVYQVRRNVYWLLGVYEDILVGFWVVGWACGDLEHVLLVVFYFWHLEQDTGYTEVIMVSKILFKKKIGCSSVNCRNSAEVGCFVRATAIFVDRAMTSATISDKGLTLAPALEKLPSMCSAKCVMMTMRGNARGSNDIIADVIRMIRVIDGCRKYPNRTREQLHAQYTYENRSKPAP